MLKTMKADLFAWQKAALNRVVVIPTNTDVKRDGNAVMGAGLALTVRQVFAAAQLEDEYGQMLRTVKAQQMPDFRGLIFLSERAPVVFLPTKQSWMRPAIPALIEANLKALCAYAMKNPDTEYGVPLLGAGKGEMDPEEMTKLIRRVLSDAPNCTLIEYDTSSNYVPTYTEGEMNLVASKRIVVVTGHRPDKLGGYAPAVRQHLRDRAIRVLEQLKPEILVHGGALGVDCAFADAVEHLGIPTIMAEPCLNYSSKWPEDSRKRADRQGKYAEATGAHVIVQPQSYDEIGKRCMQDRNVWMVGLLALSHADSKLITVWDQSEGGTKNCLAALSARYGQKTTRYGGHYLRHFLAGHPMPSLLPGPTRFKYDQLHAAGGAQAAD